MNTKPNFPSGKAGSLMGAGIFSALTASLCCITPVLALISGASGTAAAFSWMEPARPYLIGVTVLVLGFAWYKKLQPPTKEEIQCDCESPASAGGEKRASFWHSRKFLGIVTAFAALMLAFPYYAHTFYPSEDKKEIVIVSANDVQKVQFELKGMTCQGCAVHVEHEVDKLQGILSVKASYEKANAEVTYDRSKVSLEKIEEAINSTGYRIVQTTGTTISE